MIEYDSHSRCAGTTLAKFGMAAIGCHRRVTLFEARLVLRDPPEQRSFLDSRTVRQIDEFQL